MLRNLAQKTYDVMTLTDGRWIIDSHHAIRSDAMERADAIIGEKKVEGVRVVAESERTGEEDILLEQMMDVGEKPLKIVPVEEAPFCNNIYDFYQFPARQTAGRLLRELLERKGITALELAFDYGALKMLERTDSLFPPGMQRIGTIQAQKLGEKPTARIDALYKAFDQIKETARTAGDDQRRVEFIDRKDLAGLVAAAPGADTNQKRVYVLGGLAMALVRRGDWSDKIKLVIDLAENAPDALVIEYLDEISAEVLDSNSAITDMFGGFGDSISAFRALCQVTQGRCRVNNPRSCIADFNDLMAHRPMPLTTAVLLGRVARSLSGVKPLTREGGAAEEAAFKAFLREVTAEAGLIGGPRLADAILGRARLVFGSGENLSVEDAMGTLLTLLPNRAVRLGFLFDILASPTGQKNETAVVGVLARLMQQLKSLSSLLPDGLDDAGASRILDDLKAKMAAPGFPEKWRVMVSKTLDQLIARGRDGGQGGGAEMTYKMEDAPVTSAKQGIRRRDAAAGEVLFEEGDAGDEAYLIVEGSIEIFRKKGNEQVVLAKVGRGHIVGEMSLIDNQPRMASARAVDAAKLTVVTRDDLAARLGRLDESDKVLRRIIDVFVERLRGHARMHE